MKILITGGTGMVGSAFRNVMTEHELVLVGSADYDLRSTDDCRCMIADSRPDAIVHLAAKVGGVKGNTDYVADFFRENIIMNTNLLDEAKNQNIKKVVSLLSTCIYPDNPTYPLTEDQIHNGEPHQSNFGYAYAKRMLEVHSRAIRSQYGLKYITAVPNNLYGPHDNFDLETGHVIPAIIRKIYEAKLSGIPPVFWATGKPLREFTYTEDIAKALLILVDNYSEPYPVNIGKTGETSIYEIVKKISKILGYNGNIRWDLSKPEGQNRKPSSNNNFLQIHPDFRYTNFDEGLKSTCAWFLNNYPEIRGVKNVG